MGLFIGAAVGKLVNTTTTTTIESIAKDRIFKRRGGQLGHLVFCRESTSELGSTLSGRSTVNVWHWSSGTRVASVEVRDKGRTGEDHPAISKKGDTPQAETER